MRPSRPSLDVFFWLLDFLSPLRGLFMPTQLDGSFRGLFSFASPRLLATNAAEFPKGIKAMKGSIPIAGPLRQIIELAGFDKIFPLYATVDEAGKRHRLFKQLALPGRTPRHRRLTA